MTTPHESVRTIPDDACWEFLREHRIGRLAIAISGEPDVFPVNYVVDGASVVFRTAEGSKLFAVSVGGRMAFQVDQWDHEGAISVLAHGRARELDGAEKDTAENLGLSPWVPTHKAHWIRLEIDQIDGRAFTFGPEPDVFSTEG